MSGVTHSLPQQTSARVSTASSCCSSRSTEFQTVMNDLYNLKLNEAKAHEAEKKKSFDENSVEGRSLNKRRNSIELTPGDLVAGLCQGPQRLRRKSLPSLGLVAVDIQCSIPTKCKVTNSQSFPSDMSRSITEKYLTNIPEVPKKGRRRHSLFNGAIKMANKPEGSFPRGRRVSLDTRRNTNTSSTNQVNQRKTSSYKIVECPSKWCVKVHKRFLDIADDDNKLYPHIQTRRASYAGLSGLTKESHGEAGLFPKIGRRNSIMHW